MSSPQSRRFEIERVEGTARTTKGDEVALEEPLEIRISGDTFAVTMRTPGHDRELVLGLLYAEGMIRSADDVGGIAHCGRTGDEGRENTIEVTPAAGVVITLPGEMTRRGTITTSACGVCGRQSIEDLLERCTPVAVGRTLTAEQVLRAVSSIKDSQPLFARTGGCHGAVLMSFDGVRAAGFEDVGRHNAVDKVVGAMLLARKLPLSDHVLVVSGRASFEIVQKAALAGVPVLASVSAPSSLAVELARGMNLTLAGFVRPGGFNVYSSGGRIAS